MSSKTVVLVTGCSKGGIGFALAEEFAARGCTVYATSRRLESMEGFSSDAIKKLALDVTQDEDTQAVVKKVIETEDQIDILVNNAGVGNTGPILDVDMSEIIHTFNTNVFSVVRMSKAVIPHMASRRKGTIVNIGSIAGEIPVPWGGIYSASKAALHSITDTLYMECTPFDINVLLVSPGGVKSNIATNQAPRVALPPDSLYKDYVASILFKLNLSQSRPMPAEVFAQKVVGSALQPHPPRYMTLASMSTMYRIFGWLPRGWVLRMLWNKFGESPRKAAQQQRK